MILNNGRVVVDDDTRNNKNGQCFYCPSKLGKPHGPECVIPLRSVVIRLEIEMVIDVPEFWDVGNLEFWMNEGSSCADNLVARIPDPGKGRCLCNQVSGVYLREATEQDHEFLNFEPRGVAKPKAKPTDVVGWIPSSSHR